MRRFLFFLFAVGLVACSSGKGCGPDLDLGLDFSGGGDKCTPAGGQCVALFCPSNSRPSDLHCGFLSGCCMPGGGNSSSGGSSSGGSSGTTPRPFDEGTCNGEACKAGCLCRASIENGICTSACDCSPDAGSTVGLDAGDAGEDPDASDAGVDPDAGDAGVDPDAGDAGVDPDAGDADTEAGPTTPEPPVACGLITCAAECRCLSRSLSVCECRSSACDP